MSNLGSITVTKSTQAVINTYPAFDCSYDGTQNCITLHYLGMNAGISAGTYTLKNLLQQLVNKSHGHTNSTFSIPRNCNCDCD